MDKRAILGKIKEIYEQNGNIIRYLKDESSVSNNIEDIMISYDFQAGSYNKEDNQHTMFYTHNISAVREISNEILSRLPEYKMGGLQYLRLV